MDHRYRYLIIGSGMTADAATQGIRAVDADGAIGMVGAEPDPPYDRPPLTKKLWQGRPFESIWRHTPDRNVVLHLGRRIERLDPRNKRAADDRGDSYRYDTLLLATGGAPRRLPIGSEHILYYRTAQDYRRLRALSETKRRFAVIGGGFIGSELAAALAMNGLDVTLILSGDGIGRRLFPPGLAAFVTDYYRQKGVRVLAGHAAKSLQARGEQLILGLDSPDGGGQLVETDAVAAGIGIQPNVALAEQAGLDVDDGIVVDEHLRTSHPDIYAAGDVAALYNRALGQRMRVEHEDNANMMGRTAGRNMAGAGEPYDHLPFFYSDLFDLGYEAVGELDPGLELVEDWQEPYREGIVYYLRDGRVRGVLLWNVWDQVPTARRLIAEPGPFRPADLRGRLPA
jgi:NADPH-dependent 2,4-dienoyl-CoA reductase/sulfur reductase-like enzyme